VSLRTKLALAMVLLAAGATITIGAIGWVTTARDLRQQVDLSLRGAVRELLAGGPVVFGDGEGDGARPGGPRGQPGRDFNQIRFQLLAADGTVLRPAIGGALPVSATARAIADGSAPRLRAHGEVEVDGERFRTLTVRATNGGALQVARSMKETDDLLARLRTRTFVIVLGMSALALVLALVIARQVTRRLVRLTATAGGVARSGDLDVQVPVEGRDEAARLAEAFNGMLASLAASNRAQQQLVQDAGHELRTPLTSLRTNVAVMRRSAELSAAARAQLLDDLESETRELSSLVDEIVQLATDRRDDEVPGPVDVPALAGRVVERAARRTGRDVRLVVDGDVTADVVGRPQSLERAVTNLVENALKFSGDAVEVHVEPLPGRVRVSVLDRGAGVDPVDLPHVFDRFYRAVGVRSLPGSGLGLSIVRDVVERHGGTVSAGAREGGGARFTIDLPAPAAAAPGSLPPPVPPREPPVSGGTSPRG